MMQLSVGRISVIRGRSCRRMGNALIAPTTKEQPQTESNANQINAQKMK